MKENKLEGKKENPIVTLILSALLLVVLIGIAVFVFQKLLPEVIINTATISLRDEAELFVDNVCIKERTGAKIEDDIYYTTYKMVGNEFDITCYNELIQDMNEHYVAVLVQPVYPSMAIIDWKGEQYEFIRRGSGFVVTDSNVNSLITRID